MQWYPFDMQHCFMNFTLGGTSGMFVNLSQGQVNYYGPIDLSQYYIRRTDIYGHEEKVSFEVILGRRLLSNMLTVYVPTLLLNVIALATNYFKV